MPAWLEDAVFYEIYPQSFYDSNADGIGDIKGITQKLDYILSLGCNAVWLNPCFDSPFQDAGYDVRDYRKVAPRYGTNEDLYELLKRHMRKGSVSFWIWCRGIRPRNMNGSAGAVCRRKTNLQTVMSGRISASAAWTGTGTSPVNRKEAEPIL